MNTVSPHMPGSGSKQSTSSQVTNASGQKVPARLCYVDDSRTSAYVVKRMLRPYGYVVDHFESAEPALVALVQDNYDLLLTDLKVSPKGMDGDDLVRALRNSGHDGISDMPVIVITGATDSDILAQVYDAGANHILTKPVNGDELDAEIRKLVFARKHSETDSGAGSKSTDSATTGATVVPFGPEAKKQSAATDQIPVLKSDSGSEIADELTAGSANTAQSKSESRRYLGPHGDGERAGMEKIQVHKPVPATAHKPAPRVKPTIKVKSKSAPAPMASQGEVAPGSGTSADKLQQKSSATASNTTQQEKVVLRKGPSVHARVGVKPAQAKAGISTAKTGANSAVDKAEALRKVKAAIAAKKAKFEEQQRALEQKLQGDSVEKAEEILNKLSAEELTLESDEAVTPGPAPKVKPQGRVAETRGRSVSSHEKPKSAPRNKAAYSAPATEAKGADVSSQEVLQDKGKKVDDVLEAFQQTGSNRSDILKTMDQFPLVESDMGTNFSPVRWFRMVNSILELYGPKRILTSVAVLGLIFIAYGYYGSVLDDGVPVDVTTVQQGEIFQSITVPGRVVSKLQVSLTPSIAGRVTKIYVNEGDRVKKGDLLATLDDREAKSYLNRTMANLQGAKEDVVLAERSLKRLKQAYDKGAVARQMVEESQVELRSARARESIAEEEVRTAKLSLENPRIVAPFSGTVTERKIEVGQWVVPSQKLLSLVDESQREIEVKVDAADSGGIAVGQTVNISSDAFPGLKWSESVTRLAAATNNEGHANTVSVYISLGSKAPALRFGQQVDADIRTAWNPNALKVPYGAIVNKHGKSYVMAIEKGRAHLVQVETGIEDLSHVEILQGVNIGQTVIMANGKHIKDGQKVYLASNNH